MSNSIVEVFGAAQVENDKEGRASCGLYSGSQGDGKDNRNYHVGVWGGKCGMRESKRRCGL